MRFSAGFVFLALTLSSGAAFGQACEGVTGYDCTFELSGAPGSPLGQLGNFSGGLQQASNGGFSPVDLGPDGAVGVQAGDQFAFQGSTGTFNSGPVNPETGAPFCSLAIGPQALVSFVEPAPGCIGVLIETLPEPTTTTTTDVNTLLFIGGGIGLGVGIYYLTREEDDPAQPVTPPAP